MDKTSKMDAMDLLLYSAMPYVKLKEVDEYNSADSSVELSLKDQNRIYRRITRERKYREKHEAYRPALESFKRIAVAMLIVISLGFVGAMSVQAVREALWNTIIEWYENSIFVKYEATEDVVVPDKILEYKEPVLGADFTRYEIRKSETALHLEYENIDATVVITYNQQLLRDYEIWLSNYNTAMKDIKISEYDGFSTYLSTSGIKINGILWNDGQYAYMISGNITTPELLELAQGLTIVETVE